MGIEVVCGCVEMGVNVVIIYVFRKEGVEKNVVEFEKEYGVKVKCYKFQIDDYFDC